jgi:putative ABC transport system substrate-binding protein
MRRRRFLGLVGGAVVAWPLATNAQQMPVIGFLHTGAPGPNADRLAGFRKGLNSAGFVEGQNVTIEFRWAEGKADRLSELAADLVRRQVAVITTLSASQAALAAKAATKTIPIVFQVGSDPVAMGLVASLNRPGGNATGVSSLSSEITAKRFGLLRELVPRARAISALVNPTNPSAKIVSRDLEESARALGVQVETLPASNDREIDAAFVTLAQKPGGALMVSNDPFFFIRGARIAALAARHAVPAVYYERRFVQDGGLMSYGTNSPRTWGLGGGYVGRILKGEKPADLPVMQAAEFELIINLKAAKALGLTIPDRLMALADEVIE